MADPVVVNVRRIHAMNRLTEGCAKLAKALDVAPPVQPPRLTADPQFQAMQEAESMAEFVDRLNATMAAKPTGKVAAKPVAPPPVQQPAKK